MLIALMVTALVLAAIALAVWVWPDADNDAAGSTGFGTYTAGDPPVMGDIHYTPPAHAMGFETYEPGSPPIMRDPQAATVG